MSTNEHLVAEWTSLIEQRSTVARAFDPNHPLDLLYGSDPEGHPRFILLTPEEPPETTVSRDVTVTKTVRTDGRWALVLRLDDNSLFTSFSRLCLDLVSRSRDAGTPTDALNTFFKALDEWKLLLRKYRPRRLTLSELRGLVAELWFGFHVLAVDRGPDSVAQSWTGPLGAPQDFSFLESHLCEVKARRPSASEVAIASAAQLDPGDKGMSLAVVTLDDCVENTSGAFTLAGLLKHVRALPGLTFDGRSHMDNMLQVIGLDETDSYYSETQFTVLGFTEYDVDDSFPSVRRSTLHGLPVSSVRYDLALLPLAGWLLRDVILSDEGGNDE